MNLINILQKKTLFLLKNLKLVVMSDVSKYLYIIDLIDNFDILNII